MTMAEKITERMMRKLHFSDPRKHPNWDEITEVVQDTIDDSMEEMKRIAGQDAVPSREAILLYEVRASWWCSWIGSDLGQRLAAAYFAWKTGRKYARYEAELRMSERLRRLASKDE